MKRLTPTRLSGCLIGLILRHAEGVGPNDKVQLSRAECIAAMTELRERRAADLTAEEVEALAWAKGFVSNAVPEHRDPNCYPMRALSALSKLLAAKGGG